MKVLARGRRTCYRAYGIWPGECRSRWGTFKESWITFIISCSFDAMVEELMFRTWSWTFFFIFLPQFHSPLTCHDVRVGCIH